MAKKNTPIIEINGKRYDAASGNLLGSMKSAEQPHYLMQDVIPKTGPLFVSPQPKPVHKTTPHALSSPHRPTAKHVNPHMPQSAKTLMRTVVSKPPGSLKRHLKATASTDVLAAKPTISVQPKLSFQEVDPKRLRHAQHIPKSALVQRFATIDSSATSFLPSSTPLPAASQTDIKPSPAATIPTDNHNPSQALFERALKHATAHEQPAYDPKKHAKALKKRAHLATKHSRKPTRHRATSVMAASLAVLILTAFIAWQNKANLTLRYADAKAGFHASLPGFKPVGYAYGRFSYQPGTVAINFVNNYTSHSFSIKQQTSNWDSQTLLVSYVTTKSSSYQTVQNAGRTVYIYGNNNASWVDKGILYTITSNGSLSTSDVLNVASSI